jgi:hypothetical protein
MPPSTSTRRSIRILIATHYMGMLQHFEFFAQLILNWGCSFKLEKLERNKGFYKVS